jgi:hypothetical protein
LLMFVDVCCWLFGHFPSYRLAWNDDSN